MNRWGSRELDAFQEFRDMETPVKVRTREPWDHGMQARLEIPVLDSKGQRIPEFPEGTLCTPDGKLVKPKRNSNHSRIRNDWVRRAASSLQVQLACHACFVN